MQSQETQIVGNDRPWLLLKTMDVKSLSLKLMAASQQSLAPFALCTPTPRIHLAK